MNYLKDIAYINNNKMRILGRIIKETDAYILYNKPQIVKSKLMLSRVYGISNISDLIFFTQPIKDIKISELWVLIICLYIKDYIQSLLLSIENETKVSTLQIFVTEYNLQHGKSFTTDDIMPIILDIYKRRNVSIENIIFGLIDFGLYWDGTNLGNNFWHQIYNKYRKMITNIKL